MSGRQTTAGTAGDHFRATAADHAFEPTAADPGERSRCGHHGCGREKTQHPRRTT